LRFDYIVSRTEAHHRGPGNQHRRPCERFPRHLRPRRSATWDIDAHGNISCALTLLVSRPARTKSAGATRIDLVERHRAQTGPHARRRTSASPLVLRARRRRV